MDKTSIGRRVSTGVIVGRLLVLLAAATAFVAGFVVSQRHDHGATSAPGRYVCPMHPQVVSAVPGDCPICNMALEPVRGVEQGRTIVATRSVFKEVERRVAAQVVRAPASLGAGGVVTAILYEESLQKLSPGDDAVFFRSAQPATPIPVHRTSDAVARWDSSTVAVRFTSEQSPVLDEDTGWLQIDARPREFLVVPTSAVLYSRDGAYVLAAPRGEHAFTRRSVQLGRNLDSGYVAELSAERLGAVVVLSGLHEGERVVTADTFFLDAERRLEEARGNSAEVVE